MARSSLGENSVRVYRVNAPVAGHALERVGPRSSNRSPEPATRSLTVLDTSTSPRRPARDARADVHGDAAELVADHLALARVQPGADSMPSRRTSSRTARAQRTARAGPSKAARKPSPAVSISRPRKRSSSRRTSAVVRLEQLAPATVAELGRAFGGAHDVGEQHGRQHPVRLGAAAHAGEELLDLVEDRVGVAHEGQVIVARELDVLRAGDVLGHVAARSTGSRSPFTL